MFDDLHLQSLAPAGRHASVYLRASVVPVSAKA